MFSSKAILVKKAYEYGIDTVSLLLIRMLFALPVYIVIAIITSGKRRRKSRITGRQMMALVVLGLAGYYLASYLDFQGLHYITASLERLILFVYPTMVVFISALVYRKQISPLHLLAIFITYFGVVLVFFQNLDIAGQSNISKGTLLILSSAFTYACYLVGSGDLIPKLGSLRFTSFAMIVSCLAVVIHYLMKNELTFATYPTEVYGIGIAMAVICTILPSFMIAEAIRRIGAPRVALIGSIGPVSTLILAAIFLGERIGAFQVLGTLVVISGVLLISKDKDAATKLDSKKFSLKTQLKRIF